MSGRLASAPAPARDAVVGTRFTLPHLNVQATYAELWRPRASGMSSPPPLMTAPALLASCSLGLGATAEITVTGADADTAATG